MIKVDIHRRNIRYALMAVLLAMMVLVCDGVMCVVVSEIVVEE